MRFVIRRAVKSIKLFPLPILTTQDALLLEGVGNFVAGKIVKWRNEEGGNAGKENRGAAKRKKDQWDNTNNKTKKTAADLSASSTGGENSNVYTPAFKKGASGYL